LILLVPILMASCSVQATLSLSPSGGAEASAAFRVSAPALEAWSSLRELDPTLPADPLSAPLLQKSLGPQGRVTSANGETLVTLTVPDLKKFLSVKTGEDSWEGSLDRTVVRRWVALTPWADSPAVDSLFPATASVTEAEYRDLLVYLLGPGTAEAAARALVDSSVVQLSVVAPRPLKEAPGASTISGRTAVYRWPLVRVLAMAKPIPIRLFF
jgi:hypothetical protein